MSTPPYTPSIPQASDFLSVSQGQMLDNFSSAQVQFSADHSGFYGPGNGHHKQIRFDSPVATTTVASPAAILYPKVDPITGITEAFWGNSTKSSAQITGLPFTASTNGSITLRDNTVAGSGLLMKFGSYTLPNTSTNQVVTFTTPFPSSVFCIVPEVTGWNSSPLPYLVYSTINRSSFQINFPVNPTIATNIINWVAIGN